jgi:nucleoid DNA-binding protein
MATKKDLVNEIYLQCNKSIRLQDIRAAVEIIIQKCIQDILDDQMISVGNFGTLTTRKQPDGRLFALVEQKFFDYVGKRVVGFHPSETFKELVRTKHEFLAENQEEKEALQKLVDRRMSKR